GFSAGASRSSPLRSCRNAEGASWVRPPASGRARLLVRTPAAGVSRWHGRGSGVAMRQALRSARRLVWPTRHEPEVSKPPPNLPPADVLWVPGRGETFLRRQDGPRGSVPVL